MRIKDRKILSFFDILLSLSGGHSKERAKLFIRLGSFFTSISATQAPTLHIHRRKGNTVRYFTTNHLFCE
ncbi:hypothetical protein J2X61_001205 [Bacillus sp. 3255]|nr:hypothetical protein [Bacillus sp. 3255]